MKHVSEFEFNRVVQEQDPQKRKILATNWFANYVKAIGVSYTFKDKEEFQDFATNKDAQEKTIRHAYEQIGTRLMATLEGSRVVAEIKNDEGETTGHQLQMEVVILSQKRLN